MRMFNKKIQNMNTKRKKNNSSANMSLNYKMIITVLLSLTIFSCTDNLEEEIYSDFTGDNYYEDVASAESGLYGVYDILGSDYFYGNNYLLLFQQGSDQARHWRTNRNGDDDRLANYQVEEINQELSRVWERIYSGVYRVNLLIDRVTPLRDAILNDLGNATTKEISDLKDYNNVLGDAHFLRGFFYFQLVKHWGDVPLRLSSDVTLDNLKMERTPQVEVFEQIESDMLEGIRLLPLASQVKSNGRISNGAARGILARVYLTWAGNPVNDKSKFPEAAKQAMEVVRSGQHSLNTNIERLTIGGNSITNILDPDTEGPEAFKIRFPEVFHNLATNTHEPMESMWEIHFSIPAEDRDDASVVGGWHGVTSHKNNSYKRGDPRWFATPTFYNSFAEMDSLRREWSISRFSIDVDDNFNEVKKEEGNNPRSLKWGVGKFRRYLMPVLSSNNNYDGMNWPVIRYADVLLMLAEAINESGGSVEGMSMSDAYWAVNEVRRRAMPDSPTSEVDITPGGDFRQQIRDERGWELCFERIRKPDLIRWGILGPTLAQTQADIKALGFTNEDAFFQADNFEPKHVLLPIPYAAEISQNPNILNTDPSNNGYR